MCIFVINFLEMDTNLFGTYLENIDELVVDEEKIVTYKSLSLQLGIHLNTAKQLLYAYLSKKKTEKSFPISATYLLAGKLKDGSLNITLVNEVDLESAYSKFVEITSEHVYSVQKGKSIKDLKVLCKVKSEVDNNESQNVIIKCSKCFYKARKSEVKKDAPKVKAKLPSEDDTENIKDPTKSPVKIAEERTVNSPLKSSKENIAKISKTTSPPDKNTKGIQDKKHGNIKTNKPVGNITKFFTNTAQTSINNLNALKNNNSKKDEEKKSSEDKQMISSKDRVTVTEEENNTKTKQKANSEVLTQKTKSKKETGKRKRIHVFTDSEDSDDSDKEETAEAEEETSPPVENPNTVQEDVNEDINKTVHVNKRRKKKVVDRTIMNNDYLETRKEVVFETDSEDDCVEMKENKSKEENQMKKPKLDSTNEKNKESPSLNPLKKQTTLMNFFKRN